MFQRSVSPAAVIFWAGSFQGVAFHTNVTACARVRASGVATDIGAITIVVPVLIVIAVVVSAMVGVTPVIIAAMIIIPPVLITSIVTILNIGWLVQGLSCGRCRPPAKKS